jgi:hypothetical protein
MSKDEPNKLAAIVPAGLRSIAASIPVLASLGQAWSEYDNFRTGSRIAGSQECQPSK